MDRSTPTSVAVVDVRESPAASGDVTVAARAGWSAWRRSLGVGVIVAAAVFLLRDAGFIVGLWTVPLVVFCFVSAPGPRRIDERSLLAIALSLGWLPLVGWIPGIGIRVDVPGITLAILVGGVCAYQVDPRRSAPRFVSFPNYSEIAALVTGAALTAWWSRPFGRLNHSGIVQGLATAGWDNAPHFDMYRENVELGSFVQSSPRLASRRVPIGLRLSARNPSGMGPVDETDLSPPFLVD